MAAVIPLALLARRSPRWAGAGLLVVLAADLAVADARHVATAPQAMLRRVERPAGPGDDRRGRAPRADARPVPDPPDADLGPAGLAARGVGRPGPRVRRVGAGHDPAEVRDPLRPRVHAHRGDGRALSIRCSSSRPSTGRPGPRWPQIARRRAGRRRSSTTRGAGSTSGTPATSSSRRARRRASPGRTSSGATPPSSPTRPGSTRPADAIEAETDRERRERLMHEDLQIYRNEAYYPRAWVVHELAAIAPIVGLDRVDRVAAMNDLLYPADAFWNDPGLALRDPRRRALIEVDDPSTLAPYNTGGPPDPESERVEVVAHEPQRVVLRATLDRPGLVVLADVYYPGWQLTIDGEPAPIVRTNRMMRGAAVGAGTHELVYTYDPDSFRRGCYGTAVGLLLVVGLAGWSAARPEIGGTVCHPTLTPSADRPAAAVGMAIGREDVLGWSGSTRRAIDEDARPAMIPRSPAAAHRRRDGGPDAEPAEGRPRAERAGLGGDPGGAVRARACSTTCSTRVETTPGGHPRAVPQGGAGAGDVHAGDRARAWRRSTGAATTSPGEWAGRPGEGRTLVVSVQEHDRGPRAGREPAAAAGRGLDGRVRPRRPAASASGSPTTA